MHSSLERAEKERERLVGRHPEKQFRIYRVKRNLHPSDAGPVIKRQRAALQEIIDLCRSNLETFPLYSDIKKVRVIAERGLAEEKTDGTQA
jgi:hypothetical protein